MLVLFLINKRGKEMKTMIKIISVLLIISFTSCGDKITRTFTANAPIYMLLEDLREQVGLSFS